MQEASNYYYTGSDAEEFIVILLAKYFDKANEAKSAPKKTLSQKEAEKKEEDDKEAEKKDLDTKENENQEQAHISKMGDDEFEVCPLLEEDATQIGISNKAHEAALNSVQFLWVYKKINALI